MSRLVQSLLILTAPVSLAVAIPVVDRAFEIPEDGFDYVVRFALPGVEEPVDLPRVDGPGDPSRPLVVLDPGHGGFDPGAGEGALKEKTVALAIARALRDALLENGGVRVAMTREEDRFIALADRPDIARRLNADLFVSIHADSAASDRASGASVYVLSEAGSSEAAKRFAERENGADAVNGVSLDSTNKAVDAILLDLAQRGAQSGSAVLARLMLRELEESGVELHRGRVETAALAVLKAPDIPSLLLETGYINNARQAEFLGSKAGQETLAGAAARAIRVFFARNVEV